MELLGVSIGMPVFWLAVGVVFAIIEALTMGLTCIWFTGGALVSLVVSLLGGPIWIQILLFFVVSILLLIFTRKIFVKKLHTGEEKTNVNALVGKEAIVTTEVKPFKPGRVKLNGQDWTAIADSETLTINVGTPVIVKDIEGVKAIVSPKI